MPSSIRTGLVGLVNTLPSGSNILLDHATFLVLKAAYALRFGGVPPFIVYPNSSKLTPNSLARSLDICLDSLFKKTIILWWKSTNSKIYFI